MAVERRWRHHLSRLLRRSPTSATTAAPSHQGTAARISAALDSAFRQHLNLMLRPHLAQRLHATAALLPVSDYDDEPGRAQLSDSGAAGRRSTLALPYLGESLMAAMDMTGRSPARSSPVGALSGSLTRAGSALPGSARSNSVGGRGAAFAAGSPDLIPFTGFDEGLEGADESLEDGAEAGSGSTLHGQYGAVGRPADTTFDEGLERFTAFDPAVPGAEMSLEDAASGALDGALEADAAAAPSGLDAPEDAVETADDWGIRPFGNFGDAEEEDLSLEQMAAPAANGTSPRFACKSSDIASVGTCSIRPLNHCGVTDMARQHPGQTLDTDQHQSAYCVPAADLCSRMARRQRRTHKFLSFMRPFTVLTIDAGAPEADEGLRLMQACMDTCGDLGLASLRLQTVTTAMCARACSRVEWLQRRVQFLTVRRYPCPFAAVG